MKIEIRHSADNAILFEGEFDSYRSAVEAAVRAGTNLTDAYLREANLIGADLTGANLFAVNLRGADLTRANLTNADLMGANLTGANLNGAWLTEANLTRANLTGANLTSVIGYPPKPEVEVISRIEDPFNRNLIVEL